MDYNEEELAKELAGLPIPHRTAFAAAIAERLLPAYVLFTQQTGRGAPTVLRDLLDGLWNDLEGRQTKTEQEREIELCESLIPGEDKEPWVIDQPYADDASSALVYALRSRKDGAVQDVIWAARRAYDALDHFVTTLEGIDVNEPGADQRILSHHLVQSELWRQERDLRELAANKAGLARVAEVLRIRAKAESASVFNREHSETPTLLESQVLAKFLEGEVPALVVLRQQLEYLVVTSRESSSAGFFTHFRIAAGAPRLTPPISSQLDDVFYNTPRMKNGGGFVLWIAKGYLELLEGYTFDEPWPEPMTEFVLYFFDGERRDLGDIARRLQNDTRLSDEE